MFRFIFVIVVVSVILQLLFLKKNDIFDNTFTTFTLYDLKLEDYCFHPNKIYTLTCVKWINIFRRYCITSKLDGFYINQNVPKHIQNQTCDKLMIYRKTDISIKFLLEGIDEKIYNEKYDGMKLSYYPEIFIDVFKDDPINDPN
jgi:hypothetical protein